MAICLPSEFVAQVTGHDMRVLSALFEYLDTYLAVVMAGIVLLHMIILENYLEFLFKITIVTYILVSFYALKVRCPTWWGLPGALVLAGWVPFPWGQLGAGPTPPSLLVIVNNRMVDQAFLENVIDNLLGLHAAAPAQLRVGGQLRPAIHITFASLVMYYPERKRAGEMNKVLARMEQVLYEEATRAGQSNIDTTNILTTWGEDIKRQFLNENMRLTLPHNQAETPVAQVRAQVQ